MPVEWPRPLANPFDRTGPRAALLLGLLLMIASAFVVAGDDPLAHGPGNPGPSGEPGKIQVYHHDGSLQCEPDSGIPLEQMAAELEAAGIETLDSRTGHDDLARMAVCGAPTGNINIYTIDEADLQAARALGFERLEP